jgi:3-methylfumaryl-CoA hydratase
MTGLAEAIAGWRPGPQRSADLLHPWPVAALSALLDLPETAAAEGAALPPLWHWLYFLDHPRGAELGADGHPTHGHFLPPVSDRRRMFAGGRLRVHAPMRVGERIERRSALAAVQTKYGRSGEMAFVTLRHEFRRAGELLVTEEQDIVYRSQLAGAPRQAVGQPPTAAGERPHRWRLELPTDPTLLFRFSALTYNSHRIHYDLPYASGVEGYPGLVVHGPLLALLLLEIPRRELPERSVGAFDYRLVRPAFAGGPLVAVGDRDGDTLALAAGTAGRAESITATARPDGP